jgi:hypothetical protein
MSTKQNPEPKRPVPEGTFLLGLGVQKAGTTWLHDVLSGAPQVDLGFVKEYHVWDIRDTSQPLARKAFMETMASRFEAGQVNRRFANSSLRSAFIHNPSLYFDYFEDRLWRPDIKLTGDITPSYSNLSAPDMRKIRDGFRARSIPVRTILILRDPIMRMRSMLRMHNREHGLYMDDQAEFTKMREMQSLPLERVRSDYKGIIQRAESVFGKRLLILFYEELFTPQSINKICNFLRIDTIEADFTKRINASNKSSALNADQYTTLAAGYHSQMDFLRDHFSAKRMAALWPALNNACS